MDVARRCSRRETVEFGLGLVMDAGCEARRFQRSLLATHCG